MTQTWCKSKANKRCRRLQLVNSWVAANRDHEADWNCLPCCGLHPALFPGLFGYRGPGTLLTMTLKD